MIENIIVDIDGTIASLEHRLKYITGETKDYDAFYDHCLDDGRIDKICEIVSMFRDAGKRLVFITGRPERVREKTLQWLELNLLVKRDDILLLMRKDHDFRKDSIIKFENLQLINSLQYGAHNMILPSNTIVLEDRDSVVEMWRKNGYTTLQVAKGTY